MHTTKNKKAQHFSDSDVLKHCAQEPDKICYGFKGVVLQNGALNLKPMTELMAVMQDPLELSDATADNLGAFVLAGSGAVGTAHDFFDIMLVLHVNQPGHKLQPIQRSQLLRLMAKRVTDILPGECAGDLSAASED